MTGFIGAGNMANAIIKGMISSGAVRGDDVMVYDIDSSKVEKARADYGVKPAASAQEVAKSCSELVLAVKPYDFEKLLKSIYEALKEKDPLIISIADGHSTEYIS